MFHVLLNPTFISQCFRDNESNIKVEQYLNFCSQCYFQLIEYSKSNENPYNGQLLSIVRIIVQQ